jgi:hypothetical protein
MLAVLRRLIVGFVGGGCQGCVGSETSDGRSVCEVAGVFDEIKIFVAEEFKPVCFYLFRCGKTRKGFRMFPSHLGWPPF